MLAAAFFPLLSAGCGNFTCQTKPSRSDEHFVLFSPDSSRCPLSSPSISPLFSSPFCHLSLMIYNGGREVVLLEGQVRSHCIICRLCNDWMQAWKFRLNSLSKGKMWRKKEKIEREDCLMHYLSRPFGGEGTPLFFQEIKNKSTDWKPKQTRRITGISHTRVPFLFIINFFHEKYVFFVYSTEFILVCIYILKNKKKGSYG